MTHLKHLIAKYVFVLFRCHLMIGLTIWGGTAKAQTNTQAQELFILQRISTPIELDGMPDESVWDEVEPLPLTTQFPIYRAPASRATDIRFAYDDNYMYIGAKCFEDPEMIKAKSYKRDITGWDQDWIAIYIDAFNDNETALHFYTFPTGARTDIGVFNDCEPFQSEREGVPMIFNWNTFWDVEARQDDKGWYTEIRIPFSSIKFQDDNGKAVMGLTVTRWMAKRQEMLTFPDIPPAWGRLSSFKPSQSQKVLFEGVKARNPVYLRPFVTSGMSQEFDLNTEGTTYERSDAMQFDIGGDLKYGITKNLTLDLTVNTDFAQVEADNQQVNLTRFSLFFPENRQFFLERASIFDFNFGQQNSMFYSRRIGLNEGRQVPIIAGTRLVGQMGKWDIGLINMQTAKVEAYDQSMENVGVTRFRKKIFNPYSRIGFMTTHRLGTGRFEEGRPYNFVYGVDGSIRLFGLDYLLFNWAQSFENGLDNQPLSLDPARMRFSWEKRKYEGLSYGLTYARSGREYSPGLGFEFREDFTYIGDKIAYGWLASERSKLLRHQLSLKPVFYLRNDDGRLETAKITAAWETDLRAGHQFVFSLNANQDNIRESFELSEDAQIPIGNYSYQDFQLFYQAPSSYNFRPIVNFQAGQYYDGNLITASFNPTWVITNYLLFDGYYQYSRAKFSSRDQIFRAHIARLRLQYTPGTKITLASFLQYNTAAESVIANVRFRFNPKEGNDFYIVYNDDFNTGRGHTSPRMPLSSGRTLLLKYAHTFAL